MKGLWITSECMRMAMKLFSGIECDQAALKRGLTPEVFATDLALKYVAEGMPFRTAYDRVKEELSEGVDPKVVKDSMASRTHLGSAGALDLAGAKAKARKLMNWQRKCCRHLDKAEKELLSAK